MHLLATSPLKCYAIRAHVSVSSHLHRTGQTRPALTLHGRKSSRPGQNVPGFVREPWVSAACGRAGLDHTRWLASSWLHAARRVTHARSRAQTEDEVHHIW